MKIKRILLTIIFILILLYLYNYKQISQVYINKLKISSKKLKKPLKITQISDFHSNELVDLDKLFIEIKGFNPDIIVLTGDLIDYKTRDLSLAFEVIERAKSVTSRIFFVSGNHETNHILSYDLYNEMVNRGISVLDESTEILNIDNNLINIMGVPFFADESHFIKAYKNIENEGYNLLLSHSPNRPIRFLDNRVDLILSGHTHGGQVRLPIIGAIIAPGQGLFPKYDKGIFELGDTILYIDSGLGNSVANLRLLNRIQITNIEILPE